MAEVEEGLSVYVLSYLLGYFICQKERKGNERREERNAGKGRTEKMARWDGGMLAV